jgi:Fe-S-cluster-containing dehydrogenase component
MKKWNLVVDVAECHGCNNCFVACKDEHVGNNFPGYSAPQPLHGHKWIDIRYRERGHAPVVDAAYLPTMCNHCDNAPCVAQGRGAVIKRPDGIVIIDPELSKGRRDLVDSCPYGAIWWNEELQVPQTWIFDAHLLDQGWAAPRAVQSCPTSALRALKVSDEDMAGIRRDEHLEVLAPEHNTRPRVYYKNLHRYRSNFIGGVVLLKKLGTIDCAANAAAELWQHQVHLQSVETDAFGEFKFDGLPPHSGTYTVRLLANEARSETHQIEMSGNSIVLPDTVLQYRDDVETADP